MHLVVLKDSRITSASRLEIEVVLPVEEMKVMLLMLLDPGA